MSITSRINEMSSHIEQAYDELQGLGADLTNVNKNIENISMVLDDIYDSLPSVSGEGTSLTLDDTRVGKIKSTLKGNTSQTGTPTPTSPIPVNVVSGDNEIVVSGKNLLITNGWQNATISPDGSLNYGSDRLVSGYIPIASGTTKMVLSANISLDFLGIAYYDEEKTYISRNTVNDNNKVVGTIPNNTKFVRVFINRAYTTMTINTFADYEAQIEYGENETTYEAPINNTYNIDLPVENLLQCNLVSTTTGGVTVTNNNDESFTLQGTSTVGIGRDIHGEITLPAGTYTFSADHLPAGVYISLANVSNTILNRATPSRTFTISTDTTYAKCLLWIDSGYTVNDTIKIQLEKGSKQNNFTPYGTTPIELCKIGTYQDKFIRTSGKNLFNKNDIYEANKIIQTDGAITSTQNFDLYKAIVQPNASYTLSITNTSGTNRDCRIVAFTSNGTYIQEVKTFSVNANVRSTSTFTTPANTSYILYHILKTNSDVQLEKGTTATDYEPYGVGKWYLHKEIGKVVLDGSENWIYDSSHTRFLSTIYSTATMLRGQGFCDHYKYGDSVNRGCFDINVDKKTIYMFTPDNSITTSNTFKTWLGTNLPIVYYILATPTNTEITYQPLIDQLNELEKAMSKDGQTNISQVNNDLPFIISASALKEWSV